MVQLVVISGENPRFVVQNTKKQKNIEEVGNRNEERCVDVLRFDVQLFSTAGTHRNKGRVGQTSLSRSIVYNGTCVDYPCNKPTFKNTSAEYHSQGSMTRRNVNKLMALHYKNLDGTSAKETGPQAVNLQGPMPFAKNVAPVSSSEYMRTALPYKECMDASVCKKLTPPASLS